MPDLHAQEAVSGLALEPELTAPADVRPLERSARQVRVGVEPLVWAGLVAAAALTRLPALDALPLRLSDSERALAAWQVAQGRVPPIWNGDLGQTLTAAVFKLFGSSDGLARLVPALLGVALVAAFWLLRPVIGRMPALIATLLITFSPVAVAVSRSLSAYSAGALFAVVATAALFAFLRRPRPAPLAVLAGVLGLGLSSDATFLVFLLAGVCCCLVEGLWRREASLVEAGAYLGRMARTRRQLLLSLLLIWLGGFLLAATHFGLAPERLRTAAFSSWSSAFSSASGGLPWHFALDALAAYDPLLLIAGVAGIVLIALRAWRQGVCLFERWLFYWLGAALLFALFVPQRSMGQLLMLLAPLALTAGLAFTSWLTSADWESLRHGVLPALLAFPAFAYVLIVLESSTTSPQPSGLSFTDGVTVLILLATGCVLLIAGAVWTRRSAGAYLAIGGLLLGLVFGLHTLTHLAFQGGDEFLFGPAATANAAALAQEIRPIAPTLSGPVSLAPSLAPPMAWYTRAEPSVLVQGPNDTSAALVVPVDQTAPAPFRPLVTGAEIARSWYPASIDPGGILRWLLYRQAWGHVHSTIAQFLITAQ